MKFFLLILLLLLAHNQSNAQWMWRTKPGSCSPPVVGSVCDTKCRSDSGCRGDLKCCPTACGGFLCSAPVTQINDSIIRPGACPSPDKHPGEWICGNSCSEDTNCREGQKCCENACGANVCTTVPRIG